MPPSLSKGGIRNEKGSGKADANELMSEPKRRRAAASTDHVRPASLGMFHVKHPFALAKERAFGLGLDLELRALPERGGGYPSKCSAATSS